MQEVGGGLSFTVENGLDAETLRVAASARGEPMMEDGTLTHDADFALIAEALCRVAARHSNVDVLVVGFLELPGTLRGISDRVQHLPARPYEEYLALLAEGDIAIAPLLPTEFNEAKSNIKFLEAAAVGISTVCSPRSAFAGAIRHGVTGFLAESEEEWFVALDALVADRNLRERVGEAARQYVLLNYAPAAVAGAQLVPLLEGHRPKFDPRLHVMQVNVLYRPQSFGGATILMESLARLLHARQDTRVSVLSTAPAGSLPQYRLHRSDEDGIPTLPDGNPGSSGLA
jgi:hypothetical protein